jgi:hypothetical protein
MFDRGDRPDFAVARLPIFLRRTARGRRTLADIAFLTAHSILATDAHRATAHLILLAARTAESVHRLAGMARFRPGTYRHIFITAREAAAVDAFTDLAVPPFVGRTTG